MDTLLRNLWEMPKWVTRRVEKPQTIRSECSRLSLKPNAIQVLNAGVNPSRKWRQLETRLAYGLPTFNEGFTVTPAAWGSTLLRHQDLQPAVGAGAIL